MGAPDNSTSEHDRRLASTDLHEGVPYIIKNGNAELAWYGGWWDGTYVKNYIYPVYARQHTKGEKMWVLKKGGGNQYLVKLHPDNGGACWYLSWNALIDHRMTAEMRCDSSVKWEFRKQQEGHYQLINQHAHFRGTQLYNHYGAVLVHHASAQQKENSIWQVRPGYSVRGYWEKSRLFHQVPMARRKSHMRTHGVGSR